MAEFVAATGTGDDWRACVDAGLAGLPDTPQGTLGFAYWTDALASDSQAIVAALRAATGVQHWVGTVALGVCGSATVHFDRPALSLLIGDFAPGTFRVFPPVSGAASELSAATREWVHRSASHVAFVHADQHSSSLEAAMHSLVDLMEGGFLIGGVGSARGACPQLAGTVVSGGLSGVFFSEQVALATRLSQGCTPIGPARAVTRGGDNVVMELDGRPALEVFKEDIGEVLARDLSRVAGYIFAAFSVPASDTGEYLVRNLVGIDPASGAIAIGERVTEGARLMFCRRDPHSAVEDMERMLAALSGALQGRQPRGGIYVSCLARGPNQFEPGDLEMRLIRRYFGDLPLTGFFANGEISNDRLYAYTGVLTVFV